MFGHVAKIILNNFLLSSLAFQSFCSFWLSRRAFLQALLTRCRRSRPLCSSCLDPHRLLWQHLPFQNLQLCLIHQDTGRTEVCCPQTLGIEQCRWKCHSYLEHEHDILRRISEKETKPVILKEEN